MKTSRERAAWLTAIMACMGCDASMVPPSLAQLCGSVGKEGLDPDHPRCVKALQNYCAQHPEDLSLCDGSVQDSGIDAAPRDATFDTGIQSDAADATTDATIDAKPTCMCTTDKSVCIELTATCVECTTASNTCGTTKPLCHPSNNQCVECLGSSDCKQSTKPVCGTSDNVCRGCMADNECSSQGKVCREETGECVACTADSEATQCGAKSCNPATRACTQTDRASVNQCGKCVTDSECKTDHRCIEMFFQSASRGGYCMKRLASGCEAPFRAAPINRGSLSGATPENYCGIVESRTSCEAVLSLLGDRACPNGQATECSSPGAICDNVNGGARRCTYSCEISAECPSTATCPTSGSDRYCGKI